MKEQYYIVAAPGSSMAFLTAVIGKYLGYTINVTISPDGHCHNLGNGNWQKTDVVYPFPWPAYDKTDIRTEPLLVGHHKDLDLLKQNNPNIKIILIDFTERDTKFIATMATVKAITLFWSEEMYNKLVGSSWPPYSADNILTSDKIRNELINETAIKVASWKEGLNKDLVDYTIDYQTVFGLSSTSLSNLVATMLNKPLNQEVDNFIKEYQRINHSLYKEYISSVYDN